MDFFVAFQHIVPQKMLTGLVGIFADVRWRPLKNLLTKVFIAKYGVDLSEAASENDRPANVNQYATFNEFFTRELKSDARPLSSDPNAIVSPADGVVSEVGQIHQGRILQAKGIDYSVARLLGDEALAETFDGGTFATIYLSPRDYHRVHMPTGGRVNSLRYIPGKLFSVNPRTAAQVDSLFARNERLVAVFSSGKHEFALIMVGAMIVAGIETTITGRIKRGRSVRDLDVTPQDYQRGDQFGQFHLGSTAIVVFPKTMNPSISKKFTAGDVVNVRESIGTLAEKTGD